ncbi:hypothetical protein K8O68_03490 [Salipaludibacillus sp. CUR1]|uniref:hypothetical protein n=1 Tax=Salipaludibacillus sp. CUR1 TaxID=2820003 RepID=UPI001E30FA5B|nr:hypothetical protein [Salipaludibacillus sp. CUR1]MCE7791487.1 hypothetical protein [Salipaludibacillus sp. CUR1]
MLKKMLYSMVSMTVIIMAGILVYLSQVTGLTFALPEESPGSIPNTFENENYLYYLTDDQINDAIKKAVSSTDSLENFLLETIEDTTDGGQVAFAYIETPYLTVINEARKSFDLEGRQPPGGEIREKLTDSFLPVHIRFYQNKGFVHDVKIIQQDEEVIPFKTETNGSGAVETIYLNIMDLDMTEPAYVYVMDRVNEEAYQIFKIDFYDYQP